jgi:hypothetical protein
MAVTAVVVLMVVAVMEVARLLAAEVVKEVRLPSRDSIIVIIGEPAVLGASATTNCSEL